MGETFRLQPSRRFVLLIAPSLCPGRLRADRRPTICPNRRIVDLATLLQRPRSQASGPFLYSYCYNGGLGTCSVHDLLCPATSSYIGLESAGARCIRTAFPRPTLYALSRTGSSPRQSCPLPLCSGLFLTVIMDHVRRLQCRRLCCYQNYTGDDRGLLDYDWEHDSLPHERRQLCRARLCTAPLARSFPPPISNVAAS